MLTNKINKTITKNARNRELLYAEAQEKAINEQRKALKKNKEPKVKRFKDVKRLFYSINHTKPRNFKVLYYKTLSRNHILDISDTTPGSPLMLLTNNVRTNIIESFKGPEFDKRELENLVKLVKNMKTTNRGLKTALNQLKLITKKDSDTTTSTSVLKFILKKHLEEAHLFEIPLINSFSECDYVVKFWGPLVEKGFKNTSIISHWGDTFPGSLLTLGIRMKMDLRLIAIDKNQFEDHGYGEVAKQGSVPKYFKDKRKAVIACKALLNSIITSNAIDQEKESVFIPYLIVMGFEMHLYVVHLKSNHFYITQKVKSIAFPSRLADFGEESIELANGLLDLVTKCEAIKKRACRGKKRKCMDDCIGSTTVKQRGYGTSKIVWDNVDEHELEDKVSDDEVDDDDDDVDDEVNDENDEEDSDDEGNNV